MLRSAITPTAPCKHSVEGMREHLLPTIAVHLLSWVSQRREQLTTRRAHTHLTQHTGPMRLARHACTGGFTHLAHCATASHCWHRNHRMMSWFGARLTSCDNELSLDEEDGQSPDQCEPWPCQPREHREFTITDDPIHLSASPRHPKAPPRYWEARALFTCNAPNVTASQTQSRLCQIDSPAKNTSCLMNWVG